MRAVALLPFAALACALAGSSASCTGVQADTGSDAYLQIGGAQFVRGPMPLGSASGPSVAKISLVNNNIWAGLSNNPLSGLLAPTGTSAAVELQGDVGYWILVAGPPGFTNPDNPTYSAGLQFSQGIILGSYTLVVRAVD